MMLQGKVAVITGAGSGIGRAIAKGLAKRSCHLALVDVSAQGLEQTLALLPVSSAKYSLHVVNVTSEEAMKKLPEEVIKEHGVVDMLFNNAGTTIERSFDAHSMDDWRFMINLNLYGVLYGCHYFLPHLRVRPEASKKLFALVEKVAMDADKAAEKIIRAAEKKHQRVIVGMDSRLVEWLKRLFPVMVHRIAALAFKMQRLS